MSVFRAGADKSFQVVFVWLYFLGGRGVGTEGADLPSCPLGDPTCLRDVGICVLVTLAR
jgi:hypothetical protein